MKTINKIKTINAVAKKATTTAIKDVANKAVSTAIKTKKFVPKTTQRQPLETQYVKLSKNDAIAESKSAVLFAIGDIAVWFNKKGLFPSEYTNRIDVSIVINWTYNYISLEDALNNDNAVEPEVITGQELFTYALSQNGENEDDEIKE